MGLAIFAAAGSGCIAPQPPVPTFWQKLGIPQAGARLRDGLVNRRGNFPGLEKKPPILKLADPANLLPEKPEMIKTAAKIKIDQDLKKQKIKAIKFLAEVNCGCYNKDQAVEQAFLAALADCDPDVRLAAVEGLAKAAGSCVCRTGCETTCCTKAILKKLDDMANGIKDGCYKEPVAEIRCAAAKTIAICPVLPPDPPEELDAPDAEVEEPKKRIEEGEGKAKGEPKAEGEEGTEDKKTDEKEPAAEDKVPEPKSDESTDKITYSFTDREYGSYELPPVVVQVSHARAATKIGSTTKKVDANQQPATGVTESLSSTDKIANPEQLIPTKAVEFRSSLGELLLDLPESFTLETGWTMVIVDATGRQGLGKIAEIGGKRLLVALEDPAAIRVNKGDKIRLGLVAK